MAIQSWTFGTRSVASVLLATALLCGGCGSGASPTAGSVNGSGPGAAGAPAARLTTDILGEEWILVAFAAADSTLAVALEGTRVTLRFDADGTVAGHGGCNGYGGAWRTDADGALQIDRLVSTLIACDAGVLAQEQRFFRALETAYDVTRNGERLRLDHGDAAGHLRFERLIREQARPEPFTDLLWQLEHFESIDGDAVSLLPVLPGAPITAYFAPDGGARGSTGCNDWSARWSGGDDGTMAFTELSATEKACGEPEGLMAQERRFLDALLRMGRVLSWTESLSLLSADGTAGLQFVPAGDEPPPPVSAAGDTVYLAGGLQVRWRPESCSVFLRDGGFAPPEPHVAGRAGGIDFAYVLNTYCNADEPGVLRLRPVIDGARITLHAVFRGDPVRCTCQIPLNGAIDGLAPGRYAVSLVYAVQRDSVLAETEVLDARAVEVPAASRVLSIRGGTSFGECRGYCWQELTVTAEGLTLVSRGWDLEAFPERRAQQPAAGVWERLRVFDDVTAIGWLDERIGCPDCADGGAEWIEVETALGRKRVTYEHGTPPRELAQLAGALKRLRTDLEQHYGVPTVVYE